MKTLATFLMKKLAVFYEILTHFSTHFLRKSGVEKLRKKVATFFLKILVKSSKNMKNFAKFY
jgi:hypothetical protein